VSKICQSIITPSTSQAQQGL